MPVNIKNIAPINTKTKRTADIFFARGSNKIAVFDVP